MAVPVVAVWEVLVRMGDRLVRVPMPVPGARRDGGVVRVPVVLTVGVPVIMGAYAVGAIGPNQDPNQPTAWTVYLAGDDTDATAFGYHYQAMPGARGDYLRFHLGEAQLGGMGGVMDPYDVSPSHWVAYFSVAHTDAVVTAATGAGGALQDNRWTPRSGGWRFSPTRTAPSSLSRDHHGLPSAASAGPRLAARSVGRSSRAPLPDETRHRRDRVDTRVVR